MLLNIKFNVLIFQLSNCKINFKSTTSNYFNNKLIFYIQYYDKLIYQLLPQIKKYVSLHFDFIYQILLSIFEYIIQEDNSVIQKGGNGCSKNQYKYYVNRTVEKIGSDCNDWCLNQYDSPIGISENTVNGYGTKTIMYLNRTCYIDVNNYDETLNSCQIKEQKDECVNQCPHYWFQYETYLVANDDNNCTADPSCDSAKNSDGQKLQYLNPNASQCISSCPSGNEIKRYKYNKQIYQICVNSDYGCNDAYGSSYDKRFKGLYYYDKKQDLCIEQCQYNVYDKNISYDLNTFHLTYAYCTNEDNCNDAYAKNGSHLQYLVMSNPNNVCYDQYDPQQQRLFNYSSEQIGRTNLQSCQGGVTNQNGDLLIYYNPQNNYCVLNCNYYFYNYAVDKYNTSEYDRYCTETKQCQSVNDENGTSLEYIQGSQCVAQCDNANYKWIQTNEGKECQSSTSCPSGYKQVDNTNECVVLPYPADSPQGDVNNPPSGYYDCQLNISVGSSTYLIKTLRSEYECIEISSEYQELARQIIQSQVYNYNIYSVSGYIPKVYFHQGICEKLEKRSCYQISNQKVYYFDQIQQYSSLTNQSQYFFEDELFIPWNYVVNQSSQEKIDCILNITLTSGVVIKKTLRSDYECITIQQENLDEAKQIIQSKVPQYNIQSIVGQIPRIYFQQNLCEKIENHQCKDLGYNEQVQFFDECYQNNQLQIGQTSAYFQNDSLFQSWRYVIDTSSSNSTNSSSQNNGTTNSTKTDDETQSGTINLTVGALCGIGAGILVVVLVIAITICCCVNAKVYKNNDNQGYNSGYNNYNNNGRNGGYNNPYNNGYNNNGMNRRAIEMNHQNRNIVDRI